MKKRTKVIISTIGIVLVVGVVAVLAGGGYMYYSYKSRNQAARLEGEQFGVSTDSTGCIEESLRQFRTFKENTFMTRLQEMPIGDFTSGCLDKAREVKGLCDDVPKPNEFLRALEWTIAKCRAAQVDPDGPANRIFAAVEKKCAAKPVKTVSYPER